MKNLRNSRGFTLIELLVVVLIIGILSAVALPQYEKAVAKSRATEAKMVAKAIMDGEQIYYMERGEYTPYLENLDLKVDTNNMKNFSMPLGCAYGDKFTFHMTPRGLGCSTTTLDFELGTDGSRRGVCNGTHCNMYFTVGSGGQYNIW